jgi:GNAT superfamily N-acetyltransferase
MVVELIDEAVEWMVARGNTVQWGAEPWSAKPSQVARVTGMVERHDLFVAEVDGAPVGVLIISGEPEPYVAPADEPELYVNLLLVSRRRAGAGIGTRLLDFARAQATARGISLVRLDCYAGGDGALVDYYVRAGFTPTGSVTVRDIPVRVLSQRL